MPDTHIAQHGNSGRSCTPGDTGAPRQEAPTAFAHLRHTMYSCPGSQIQQNVQKRITSLTEGQLHPSLRHTAFMFDRSHVVLIAPLFILFVPFCMRLAQELPVRPLSRAVPPLCPRGAVGPEGTRRGAGCTGSSPTTTTAAPSTQRPPHQCHWAARTNKGSMSSLKQETTQSSFPANT